MSINNPGNPYNPNDPNSPNYEEPTGSRAGGFYNPDVVPYPVRPDYQEFLNRTDGILNVQIQDAIHNLLTMTPTLHAENLLLAGENIMWLSRLTSGVQCPNWINEEDQDSISKCTICYNTGYVGGFGNPVMMKMSFIPGRADIMVEQAGLTITQRPMAWTITTDPNIEARDMIVTFQNERYLVHSAENSEKQGRNMYQNLTLSRIDKMDVLYYLPVPGYLSEGFTEFAAQILITPVITQSGSIGFNIPATMFIKNRNFFGLDGVTPIRFLNDVNSVNQFPESTN